MSERDRIVHTNIQNFPSNIIIPIMYFLKDKDIRIEESKVSQQMPGNTQEIKISSGKFQHKNIKIHIEQVKNSFVDLLISGMLGFAVFSIVMFLLSSLFTIAVCFYKTE